MRELTRAEEQVMQVLWKIRKGFVKDILEHFPDPKPAYTTISTIVRILENKGFVSHKAYGRTHEYIPLVSKEQYSWFHLNNFISDYFSGSFRNLVSCFASSRKIAVREMEGIINIMQKQITRQKQQKSANIHKKKKSYK